MNDIYSYADLFYKLASKKFSQKEEEVWELIGQKNPKIRNFLKENLGKSVDLDDEHVQQKLVKKIIPFLEKGKQIVLKTKDIPKLKNLANKPGDKDTLEKIKKISGEKDVDKKYQKLMKERDKRENRKRTYEVTDLLDQIRSGKYHPPLVLSLKDGLYVIDGRTRLYAALALDIDPKIKIITKDNFE